MQVLLREISQAAGGAVEFRDREFSGAELTFGSATECAIQIIGRGVQREHGRLTPTADGLELRCSKGATVLVDGQPVARARLAPGGSLQLAGTTLELLEPPAGFDAAIAITPARELDAEAFEAAYVTDLEQTWLSRRKGAWLLALLVILAGLLLPWWLPSGGVTALPDDTFWSSGALLPAHAVAIGDDCSACHTEPFQRVQDAQCTTCHQSMTDHAPAPLASHVGLDTTRCASCHREHNEPVHITISADALCTDCHVEPAWPDNRLATVSGFTQATHPTFDVHLLKSTAEPRGTGLVYRWHEEAAALADAVDASNLKFPHDVHLDTAKVQDLTTGEPLACVGCHVLDADDEHFAPITMENDCRACHDLKFDRSAPDRELPHGDPAEVLLTMEGHFMRLFADPDQADTGQSRRRLPGRADAGVACEGPAYLCARRKTAEEAETQFTRRGCVTCHNVTVHPTDELLSRFQVAPVKLTTDFYTASRFDHKAHLTQEGVSGNEACLSCHDAGASSTSADVLMPGIEQCVACHGDHRQRDLIPLNCIDCHQFHPGSAAEGVL